ncbi:MAG TPA: winged helix DNA-binding domain-containing protein [Vicinamibacteria bacterium]|nr:winged helix DNA-binding domain-containing protein [Vicinamibacteria bacterium]
MLQHPRPVAADTLTLRQINRATLSRQMLLARERVPAVRAVERLVAMQAQWPRPPFLGLWSRVDGFARADLKALLRDKKVVRATFLRGTLHLVTAKDFLALRPALQAMLDAGVHTILGARKVGLDFDDLVARARAVRAKGPRTFDELRGLLTRPKENDRAVGYAVRMMLPLVQVPVGDDAPWAFPAVSQFALAEKWLGRALPRSAPATVNDVLVRRYLAAYGPASAADIHAWCGLAELRAAMGSLRSRLRGFRDEKARELVDLPDAPRPDPGVPAPVRLVPEYDNLITTRADERFVAKRDRPRVFLSALRIAATVLVDGFVAGTWKLERTKSAATLTIVPFAPFAPRVRKEVEAEAEALVRFAEPDARAFATRIAK